MGKVGSSTVYATLKSHLPFTPIFHIHFLSKNWLENILPHCHPNDHWNVSAAEKVLEYIKTHPRKKVKIITLVRDPIAFEISNLFQNWRSIFDTNNFDNISTVQWTDHLEVLDFNYPLTWFDSEFKNFTQFDIYSQRFDHGKGYSIYQLPDFDILCIQLEKLDHCFQDAFSKLLGIKLKSLIKSNESKAKGEVFKRLGAMKDVFSLSSKQVNIVLKSQYIQHFYSSDQIEIMNNTWRIDEESMTVGKVNE